MIGRMQVWDERGWDGMGWDGMLSFLIFGEGREWGIVRVGICGRGRGRGMGMGSGGS